ARLRRAGELWEASFGDRTAHVRDSKGMRDLAALLAQPGVWLSALDLAGGDLPAPASRPDPVLDRTAVAAYRRRLAQLEEEAARSGTDLARQRRVADERERLLAELRRAARPDGRPRSL